VGSCTFTLTFQAEQLQKKCVMLEKNLSCLFKTAWSHLQRKEGHILKLKEELRDIRRSMASAAQALEAPCSVHSDDAHNLSRCVNPISIAS
jgi:hypothetical protein